VLAAALAAVLITGLAVPGWMLGGPGPQQVAKKAAEAVNSKDFQTIADVSCDESSSGSVKKEFDRLERDGVQYTLTIDDSAAASGDTAQANVTLTYNRGPDHRTAHGNMVLNKRNGDWCVGKIKNADFSREVAPPTEPTAPEQPGPSGGGSEPSETYQPQAPPTGGGGPPAGAKTVVQKFIHALNAGHSKKALVLTCRKGSTDRFEIKEAMKHSGRLRATFDNAGGGYAFFNLNTGGKTDVKHRSHGWCVSVLIAEKY
jgi:hypothetical protein